MRKLEKSPKPQILIDNAEDWTKQYCAALSAGMKPSDDLATKYKCPEIKQALAEETFGKCVYCESKIQHISYGDIEHILPKNKDARPDLYVEWNNLTLACAQCNRSGKGTYYNPNLLLINPYQDQPESHLQDIGPLILPMINSERAQITEKILKLNRPSLVERRTERIMYIERLFKLWHDEKNLDLKNCLEKELCDECALDKEYSSTIRSYLMARGFVIKE